MKTYLDLFSGIGGQAFKQSHSVRLNLMNKSSSKTSARRKTETPKAPWVGLAKLGGGRAPNGGLLVKREPKRIRTRTLARAKQERIYRRKRLAFLALHRRCAVYLQPSEQVHHSRGRLGPLLLDERWWIPVSSNGHEWIDRNRDQARKILWNGISVLCAKGDWGKSDP